jgi:hypothetical protein
MPERFGIAIQPNGMRDKDRFDTHCYLNGFWVQLVLGVVSSAGGRLVSLRLRLHRKHRKRQRLKVYALTVK